MGSCGCDCQHRENTQYEMFDGSLPDKKSSTKDTNNQREEVYISERIINKKHFEKNYKHQLITLETEFISKNQERNEYIFDFFNQIRLTPENYLNDSKRYNLYDLFQTVIDNKYQGNKVHLIKNPFLNIFLEETVNVSNGNKNEILNKLAEESRIRNYNKQLYIVETSGDEPIEAVWILLKENKKIALKEFFGNKIDYLIVSSQLNKTRNKIIAYFLILKKKDV